MIGWVSLLDILQLMFFMNVDEDISFDCREQSGSLDLPWLKDYVAVRQDDGLPPLPDVLHRVERVRKQEVGKGIVQQEVRHAQEVWITRVFAPIALERTEVVSIAEFSP